MTPMQEGMLFHYLQDPGNDKNFEQLYLEVSGKMDSQVFKQALDFVVHTNEMLRTVFRWERVKKPTQIVLKDHSPELRYFDLSHTPKDRKEELLADIKVKDRQEKFDLRDVPFRVTLCKLDDDRYGIIISNHHILYDGWSTGIILNELLSACSTLTSRQQASRFNEEPKTKYKEFVRWIQDQDTEQEREKQKKFWQEYLQGFETGQEYDGKRKGEMQGIDRYQCRFRAEVKSQVEGFLKKYKILWSSLLYGAWGILLQKYNHCDDVLFDTTVSGRSARVKDIENIVGLFINTLPLRVKNLPNESILDFMTRMNGMLQSWQEFENTSLFTIKEYLDRCGSDFLFDSLVVIENYPLNEKTIRERSGFSINTFSSTSMTHYDVTLIITTFADIEMSFAYNTGLFSKAAAHEMAHHFINILENIIENPEKPVEEIEISIERFPLTGREEPSQEPTAKRSRAGYTAPRTQLEHKLVKIWSNVLGLGRDTLVGIHDHFFDFGGHSLKAALLAAEVHKALNVKVPLAEIFRYPTVKELAQYIAAAAAPGESKYVPLKPVEKKEYYPLSPSQRQLYMIQQFQPGSTAYNGPLILLMEGKIDKNRMENAFKGLINSHESLRTSFTMKQGRPVQRIHDQVEFEIEYDQPAHEIDHFIRAFNLSHAPLLRAALVGLADGKYLLMIDMHHIITDGTSTAVLSREFASLYNGEELPPQKIQYRDFSEWQQERLHTGQLTHQQEYWMNQLSGDLPILNMPTDFPRPRVQCLEGERISFELGRELRQGLTALMKSSGTSLYMVLLAVYYILLSRYSGQEDIIIGTPAAGRNHADLGNTVGFFLETLTLRGQPQGDKTFTQFLQEVKSTTLAAYENQDYPFAELIRQPGKTRDLSRNPMFDAMLNVLNQRPAEFEMEIPAVKVIPHEYTPKVSKVDFTLEVKEVGSMIQLELEYCTALFARETMARFSRHFITALRHVVERSNMPLSELEIMADSEKKQVLERFNQPTVECQAVQPVHELFAQQAERTPDSTAVVGAQRAGPDNPLHSLTYKCLDEQSNQLARSLLKKGVKSNSTAALMVSPCTEMVIGILGILKSGAGYLPIDPEYPRERIDFMMTDSGAGILVIGQPQGLPLYPGNVGPGPDPGQDVDILPLPGTACRHEPCSASAEHPPAEGLAYIIYTSGTTGRPKGVLVEHRHLSAYIAAFEKEFPLHPDDTVIQQASFSFDAFVEELYPILLNGGKLAIPGREVTRDIPSLCHFIARQQVTLITCSPRLLNELDKARNADLPLLQSSLRVIISGGDRLQAEYISNLLEIGAVYNTYGPTESTVCATYYRCKKSPALPDNVPIGQPIANYQVYILDKYHNLLPMGVPGELCIGGLGLSRGYLNRPELTAEKFIPEPMSIETNILSWQHSITPGAGRSEARIYRSGDLARWLPDGNIEFLGRIDRQVKVRGYRIELEEIENCLMTHEDVLQAAAAVVGAESMCVYFTSKKEKTVRELRDFLGLHLPGYMIPAYFVQLEQMPLNPSGKIDASKLPKPGERGTSLGIGYAPPRDEREEKLVNIWQRILARGKIGIDDDFFELGGNSLSVNQCIACMREDMHLEVSPGKFFEMPTIRALAREFTAQARDLCRIHKVARDQPIPLSFSQERLWFLQQLDHQNKAYHVPRALRIKGKIDTSLFERTFTEIIRRHEILRTVFPTMQGQPVQRILAPYLFKIPMIDLSDLASAEDEQRQKARGLIKAEGQQGFDLETGPLVRVKLLKLKEDEHIMVSTEHHLVHDGWTQGVMLKEFIALFSAYQAGKPSPLPELPIQYADFACWQRGFMQGDTLAHHLRYWRKKLAGLPPLLELPADRPRPPLMSGKGRMKELIIPAALAQALGNFSRAQSVTLFMTMLTVFKVFLHRYTGIEDLCVGTGIANRRLKEIEGMLGMVINTLALRTEIQAHLSFRECLQRVRQTCLDAYEHEDTPFEKVVEVIQPERTLSYTPIFQVMFTFMDTPTQDLRLPGLELTLEGAHNRSAKFDMGLVVILPLESDSEAGQGDILIEWEYNTDIFDDETIARMLVHYRKLLEETLKNPGKPIGRLEFLSAPERRQLLLDFNAAWVTHPQEGTLHQMFEDQVERTPHHTAVIGMAHGVGEVSLTYRKLNEAANQLSRLLQDNGVTPNTSAALMVPPSIDLAIAVLGILKSGGAYLPIDPEYPQERIDYMLKDSQAEILITSRDFGGKFQARDRFKTCPYNELDIITIHDAAWRGERRTLSHLHLAPTPGTGLAYIIYTSGTTGRPKGVAVAHRGVVNMLVCRKEEYKIGVDDTCLQLFSYAFDGFVTSFFTPIISGAAVVLLSDEEIKNIEKIKSAIVKHRVSHFICVPALYAAILELLTAEEASPLKVVTLAGEKPGQNLLARTTNKNKTAEIVNEYGVTECSVMSTLYRHQERERVLKIGHPIWNTRIYILDRFRQLQPIGVAGEMCITGIGLSRGYLNNPELTTEKFIPNPISKETNIPSCQHSIIPGMKRSEGRIYCTGDLARWLPDGNIEFLGRMDLQVKIRGFRIELGEIENRLLKHDALKEAVVTTASDTGSHQLEKKYLCAYFVPREKIDSLELKRWLSMQLPQYMIPRYLIPLKKLPKTPSGKLDRNALPEPAKYAASAETTYAAPQTHLEKVIAETWKEVLCLEKVGVHDNFFQIGGHSLEIPQLVAKLKEALQIDIEFVNLFRFPTIRSLARYLAAGASDDRFLSMDTPRAAEIREGKRRLKRRIDHKKRHSI